MMASRSEDTSLSTTGGSVLLFYVVRLVKLTLMLTVACWLSEPFFNR